MAAQPQFQQPFVKHLPDTPSSAPSLSRSPGQAQPSLNTEDAVFPDALLYIYRTNMAPQFPFVIVPDKVSAAELVQTKPFLYKVLVMVASYHEKTRQAMMAHEIFQYLSTRMICGNERSFDLLQGLLVLMAWLVFVVSIS